jgi:hypothetical protein
MTQTTDYDIVGSYNNQRISSIDAERSVNMFEYIDPLGKKPKSLINTSGLVDEEFDFGAATGGFRGQFVFKQPSNAETNEYCVIGNSIYRVSTAGVTSLLGTISNSTGYVGIDANTFQIIFVNGEKGYIWDTIASTFTMITDASFPVKPIDVCYLDGFFVVAHGDTNNFQLSSFNQGLVWGPDFATGTGNAFTATSGASPNLVLGTGTTLNYAPGTPITFNGAGTLPTGTPAISVGTTYYVKTVVNATTFTISTTNGGAAITFSTVGIAPIFVTNGGQLQQGAITTHPGTIVACRTLHRRLFLFSQNFTEVWENAGIGTNLPFRRNNALLMEYGTPAIGSVSVGFDLMFFLSQDRDGLGSVMMVRGTESIPTSNRALDFQLAQYASDQQVADCRAFLIKENGLIFYRMNFTLANHTFVYNVTLSNPAQEETKYWHEEEVLNGNRHPAQTHAYFNGNNYVGDYLQPILYRVDPGVYTNNGELIRRMRITRAFVPPGYQRIRIDRLQIDILQGNINNLQPIFEELDLLTEDGFIIQTESGDDILLQQELRLNDPQALYVFMSISKDGGQTYGYSVRAPMGNIGQRTFRTLWRKLGTTKRGQAFVAMFEFFDAVPFVILGASWAIELLPE